MKAISVVKFIAALVLCFGASAAGAAFMSGNGPGGWYAELQKPVITPPGWVFGPVWTILYLMMAVSLFIIWNKGLDYPGVKIAIGVFLFQLILNAAWTPLFFGYHLILWALIDIILLFFAILATVIVFKKISVYASLLLVPYLAWVGFAAVLNGLLWQMNR